MKTPYEIKEELELLDRILDRASQYKEEATQIKTQAILDSKKTNDEYTNAIKSKLEEEFGKKMAEVDVLKRRYDSLLKENDRIRKDLDSIIETKVAERVSKIIGSKLKDLEVRERELDSVADELIELNRIYETKKEKLEKDRSEFHRKSSKFESSFPSYKQGLGIVLNKLDWIYKNTKPQTPEYNEREQIKLLADTIYDTITGEKL
jgi:F0F1-type ATP synthase delta subunit